MILTVCAPCSLRYAGAWDHPGRIRGEAHGSPQAYVQHRRRRHLHPGLHPAAAQRLPLHHVPARHWPRAHQAGGEAAVLHHRGRHPQQPAAAQGHVLLEQRHADQVGGTGAQRGAPPCHVHTCTDWFACLQVQCEPAGGVAPRQRSDDLRRQGDSGASDPGRPAAAGEEEDWRGRRGHLLHVPSPHHCSGSLSWRLPERLDGDDVVITSVCPRSERILLLLSQWPSSVVSFRLWRSWISTLQSTSLRRECPSHLYAPYR